MNNWNNIEYQKIKKAALDKGVLTVVFVNGDEVSLPLRTVLPVGIKAVDESSIKNNEYDIFLKSSEDEIFIPWDKIRVLTDKLFAQETAKKAEENSKFIGARLKLLRERNNIKSLELAERAGVTPQTITRIEKGYTDVSFATLQKILAAMGYSLKDLANQELTILKTEPVRSLQYFLKKLSSLGIDSYLANKIIPTDIKRRLSYDKEDLPELIQTEIATYFSRIFDWNLSDIWSTKELSIIDVPVKSAYFKTPSRGNLNQIKAYSHYAYYLANIVSKVNTKIPKLEYPTDIEECKEVFYEYYEKLTLDNLVNFTWDLGISVIPLNDEGVFHGASWNINNKHVIVLKQRTDSHARWIFDLLHELYHVFVHLENENTSVVETEELNPFSNNDTSEELEANSFANQFIFGNRSEEIATLALQKANYKIDYLKKSVKEISKSENISPDFIANYLAFRLQVSDQNWWGTANSLQITDPSPFDITSDILKNRISIQTLNPIDRNLLNSAINN
jgi:transcriptional regulator with XRE-family HTH domain/Zn-dependent peptidase ImmA (M78 family)